MKLTLNQKERKLYLTPQTGTKEYERINKFPGLLRDGPYFFIPAEPRIAYNIVQRLSSKFNGLEIGKDVLDYINLPFKLQEIPASFTFFTEPKDFQRIALRYAYTVGGGGLLLDPGMGKTKVVLDFIVLMGFKKALIVCPKPLLFVWQDERTIHRPDRSIYCVRTTDWENEVSGIEQADIVVVNYNKAVIFKELLAAMAFNFIGVDEALIKDPMSDRTEAITWLGRQIYYRMLMSGTLVNNTPLDIFAPVRFLEPSLVGWSYTKFKDEYAIQVGKKTTDERGNEYYPNGKFVVGYRKVPEIKSILETVSIVMTKAEWLKLPPKTFFEIYVQPSDEQRTAYLSLQSNYICTVQGKEVEVENPLSALIKLIQISNGFIYTTPDDDVLELEDTVKKIKKRETLFFPEQPKLDKLAELLRGPLASRRLMLWYNMTAEYELISKRLEDEGITFLSIRGGDKDVGGKVRLFNSDPTYRILLCQAQSVNYGITVLGRDYDPDDSDTEIPPGVTPEVFTQLFYSRNFSLEVYSQQQDRIHRLGQEHECEYYHLLTNLEAERHILNKLKEKLSIRGQVLEDIIRSILLKDNDGDTIFDVDG